MNYNPMQTIIHETFMKGWSLKREFDESFYQYSFLY